MSDSHHSNSFLGFDSLRSNRTRHHFPRQSSILFHKGLKKMILALMLPYLVALSLPSSAYSSSSSSNTINCPLGSKHCSGKILTVKYYILLLPSYHIFQLTFYLKLSISCFISFLFRYFILLFTFFQIFFVHLEVYRISFALN